MPPADGLGTDFFTLRYTGKIEALTDETYNFITSSDDGVRLWVNDQPIIDDWTDHGPTLDVGSIALSAGVEYNIKLEFYENFGGAEIRLYWQTPTIPQQIVPQSQLYAVSPALVAAFNSFESVAGDATPDSSGNAKSATLTSGPIQSAARVQRRHRNHHQAVLHREQVRGGDSAQQLRRHHRRSARLFTSDLRR
jgi:hypothetical protein